MSNDDDRFFSLEDISEHRALIAQDDAFKEALLAAHPLAKTEVAGPDLTARPIIMRGFGCAQSLTGSPAACCAE